MSHHFPEHRHALICEVCGEDFTLTCVGVAAQAIEAACPTLLDTWDVARCCSQACYDLLCCADCGTELELDGSCARCQEAAEESMLAHALAGDEGGEG